MNNISYNDIKYDLLKIIEPWDGILESNTNKPGSGPAPVLKLFNAYFRDLKKSNKIYNFNIDVESNESSYTYNVIVQMGSGRSPKKLKIHVGKFKMPWVEKTTS